MPFADLPATIDCQHLARCKSRILRHEIDSSSVQIGWLPDAPTVQRLFGANKFQNCFIIGRPLGHWRFDQTGSQHIDADMVSRIISRNGFCKTDNGGFGRGIRMGREIIRRGRKTQHGTHIQNRAAGILLQKRLNGRLIGKHQRSQIQFKGFVPAFER